MAAFVLIHSPFVGPLTWERTARRLAERGHVAVTPALNAGEPRSPNWPYYAGRVANAVREVAHDAPLVLVAHSAAGLLVPAGCAALEGRPILSCVFVDAALPREGASLVELIPAGVGITMDQLRAQAQDGLLPPWGTGWPDDLWRQLIPDDELRKRFIDELRPAPLAVYEEHPPTVAGWPGMACGYLRFSPLYASAEAQARSAGWRTRALAGGHLHMLVDPAAVADAVIDLAGTPVSQERPTP